MTLDPGYIPKPPSLESQKSTINSLLSSWRLDESNFCTRCMIARPLRSKHCRPCDRCVAKHDHHCPWIFNCVGAANHRQFFVYIAALEVGIGFLIRLGYVHFSLTPEMRPDELTTCADWTPPALCQYLTFDSRTFYILFWSSLQLSWVTMLLIVQLLQIARAKTTYEAMHSSSTHHASSPFTTPHHPHASGGPAGAAPDSHITHLHTPFWRKLTRMLGVDVFLTTAKVEEQRARGQQRRQGNPWQSRKGVRGNCEDFWGGNWNGGTKGVWGGREVDWAEVTDTPRVWAMRQPREGGEEEEGVGLLARGREEE